ncbi:uncharacterized protein PV09_03382 [Verruconis gallopava]|uniref:acylphosphatase n=1 Tax=Verruconis gallopava TaxID=253628 RepID=A0A0D2B2M5_9PEZI|nr:uncharacterized protein PV09_03382 [Verruconis gallopava]KIW05499.1 hypothetical protein PV09_03382 [Verruconis gallopava]
MTEAEKMDPRRLPSKSPAEFREFSSGMLSSICCVVQSCQRGRARQTTNVKLSSRFTINQAKALGLTGYVQNARDGSVVGEAQGPEDDIQRLVEQLNKGPPAAKVESVELKDISTKTGETGFGQH